MERQKKVIDASVIIKWFISEVDSEKALVLRAEHLNGDSLLIIPELALIEVINALRYKNTSEQFLKEAISYLYRFQFSIERINEHFLEKAVNISLKNKISIYDSIYIAVAQEHGIEMITADNGLKNIPNVGLLNDIKLDR